MLDAMHGVAEFCDKTVFFQSGIFPDIRDSNLGKWNMFDFTRCDMDSRTSGISRMRDVLDSE